MVRGQTSKLYLRTSEFSRSQNEEQPACRCGFLELHKEPAYTSSWAIKEFIHSFVSSFTEYSERPWPRPCDIQDAGVTKRPGFAFRDLRGCECPPCPPKGWTPPQVLSLPHVAPFPSSWRRRDEDKPQRKGCCLLHSKKGKHPSHWPSPISVFH